MSTHQDQEESVFDVGAIVGAVIDGADRTVTIDRTYADQAAAEKALADFTAKARKTESDPCRIESRLTPTGDGVQLHATFEFSCQAEAMIFELSNR